MFKYTFLLALFFVANQSLAAAPTCHTHSSGNYCQYSGPVERIYVNSGNLILLYFDVPVDVSVPNGIGFTVNQGNAAAFSITENPQFANMFYSTALAAQASGRDVSMQMRGDVGGYMKIDRIWLAK